MQDDNGVTPPTTSSLIPNFEGMANFEDIQSQFIRSARTIILERKLVREPHEWQISALELYLFHPTVWRDPTTHGAIEKHKVTDQLNSGTWYIHHGGRRPPKRLGIDITAGSRRSQIHAGLLVAAIDEVDGSGRALRAIIRGKSSTDDWKYNEHDKKVISEIHGAPVAGEATTLRLEALGQPRTAPLYIGRRKFSPKQLAKLEEPWANCFLRISTICSPKLGMIPLEQVSPSPR